MQNKVWINAIFEQFAFLLQVLNRRMHGSAHHGNLMPKTELKYHILSPPHQGVVATAISTLLFSFKASRSAALFQRVGKGEGGGCSAVNLGHIAQNVNSLFGTQELLPSARRVVCLSNLKQRAIAEL